MGEAMLMLVKAVLSPALRTLAQSFQGPATGRSVAVRLSRP